MGTVDTGSGLQHVEDIPEARAAALAVTRVRVATATTLDANTRTGNKLLADAAGSLNTSGVDGTTDLAVDQLILVKDESTQANNGVYKVNDLGGTTEPWELERADTWAVSADIKAGRLVSVAEGTANADKIFQLTADDPITLNTTSLTFARTGITASDVPLVDSGSHYTAAQVEAAFAEIMTRLKATDATGLASIMGIRDVATLFTATTLEAALAEAKALVDANVTAVATAGSDLDIHRPGAPMQNRLRLLGAPGAAVEGNTVTIGADVYEFRGSTPPAGGTAGRIWVYNGANSAASRANLIAAINNEGAAAEVTYDGAVTESMYALAGITTGDIILLSATAIGSKVAAPSATATACSDGLDTATDIWDSATMEGGVAQAPKQIAMKTITLAASHVAKGTIEATFSFTPTHAIVKNRSRPQNEAWTISGNSVSLTLAGGASPNNQATDIIDFLAMA